MPQPAQWAVLVVLSAAFAALLLWLQAPAALMLGPLLAAIAVAASGGRGELPRRPGGAAAGGLGPLLGAIGVGGSGGQVTLPLSPFVVAQGVVGSMIAKRVPLSIVGDILGPWPLFPLGVLSVVGVSSFIGWLMPRLQMLP